MEIALKRLVKVFCPLQLSYHSVSVVVECVVSCHCAFAYLAGTSSAHQSYHPVVDHELFGSSVGLFLVNETHALVSIVHWAHFLRIVW